jgi:hypothetical protein
MSRPSERSNRQALSHFAGAMAAWGIRSDGHKADCWVEHSEIIGTGGDEVLVGPGPRIGRVTDLGQRLVSLLWDPGRSGPDEVLCTV